MPAPAPEDVVYCNGKVRHPSRKLAAENLNRVRRKIRGRNKDRGALVVYYCDRCRGFHLGNRSREGDGPRAGRPKPPPPEPLYDEDAA